MLKNSPLVLLFGILIPGSLQAQKQVTLASVTSDSLLPKLLHDSVSRLSIAPGTIKNANFDIRVNFVQSPAKVPIVSKPLSARAILIPSAMIAYGAFTLSNKELRNLNLALRKEVWEERNGGFGRRLPVDNFTLAAPAVAVYALNIAGVKGKNNFVDRSLILTMSGLIGNGIVSSVKHMSGIIRPDSSNTLSFPSGHTAQAFIAAEFMRQEYKHLSPWYGIAAYTVAAGTGFLRMYNNKHWFNDVIAGAGVGILSTRLSYWLYPKLKNVFVKEEKQKNSGTVIMPTYQNGAFGVGLVHSF
jgi:hypothetical protein